MVVRISAEQAKPFIRKYNEWSGSTVADENEAEKILWCGIEIKGVVRTILGLQTIDDDTVFVWGMFGDGSGTIDEYIAAVHTMHIVNNLPYKLEGAILPSNQDQQRRATKNGWRKTDTQVLCGTNGELQELWERPYKAGGV